MFPYLGDSAKLAKIAKIEKFLAKVGSYMARSAKNAERVLPHLLSAAKKLDDLIEGTPAGPVKDGLQRIAKTIDDLIRSHIIAKIGHTIPWDQMTKQQRAAFQHTYSRHAADLGLPAWKGSKAEELRQLFNNVAGHIRANGKQLDYYPMKPFIGKSVPVRFWEWTHGGVKYYYYETLDGIFISAGKAR